MSTAKAYLASNPKSPSILALLVDDISKLSVSEQKLLWMQLNQKKLTSLAKAIDAGVTSHDLSIANIDALIHEAKKAWQKEKRLLFSQI